MATVREIQAKFTARVEDMQNSINQLKQDMQGIEKQAESSSKGTSSKWTEVGSTMQSQGDKITKMGGKVKGFGKTWTKATGVITGAIGGVGTALFGLTNKVTKHGEEIKLNAQRTNMSTDGFQELTYWAEENGMSQERAQKSMERFNQRSAEAVQGNEKYADVLQQLGIDLDALEDGTLSTEDAYVQSIESLSNMESETERMDAATQLFGKNMARQMMPALEDGSLTIDEAREKAQELGLVMSEDQIEASEKFQESYRQIKNSLKGVALEAGTKLIPHMQKFADWIIANMPAIKDTVGNAMEKIINGVVGVVEWFSKLSPTTQKVIGVVSGLAGVFGPVAIAAGWVLEKLGPLWKFFGKLITRVGRFKGLLPLLRGAFTALSGPVGITIGVITALAAIFTTAYKKSETFRNVVHKIKDAFLNAITGIKQFITESPVIIGVVDKIKDAFNFMRDLVMKAFGAVASFFGEKVKQIKNMWDDEGGQLLDAFKNIFNGIKAVVKTVFGAVWLVIKPVITKIWEIVQAIIPKVFEIFKTNFNFILEIVKHVWTAIKGIIDSGLQIIRGLIQTFSGLFTGDFSKMWEGIQNIFDGAMNALKTILELGWNVLLEVTQYLWDQMKNILSLAWTGIKEVIKLGIDIVKGIVKAGWNLIKTITKSVFNGIKSFLSGIWNGIKSIFNTTIEAIVNFAKMWWNNFKSNTKSVFNGIKEFFSIVWSGIKTVFKTVIKAIVDFAKMWWTNFKNNTKTIFNAVRDFFTMVWEKIKATFKTVVRAIVNFVKERFTNLKNNAKTIFNTLKEFFDAVWLKIKTIFKTTVRSILRTVRNTWNTLRDTTKKVFNAVRDFLRNVWNKIKEIVTNLVKRTWRNMKNTWNILKETTKNIFTSIKNFFNRTWTRIKELVTNLVKRMWNSIKNTWNILKNTTKNIFTGIKNFFTRTWTQIKTKVTNLITNMYNSARNKFNTFKSTVSSIFTNIKDTVAQRVKDMVANVKAMPGRMKKGIKNGAGKLKDGFLAVARKMADGIQAGVNGIITAVNWAWNKLGGKKNKFSKWYASSKLNWYAKGTKGHPSNSPAVVGDGKGKYKGSELVTRPNGERYLSPDKPTVVPMEKGTHVTPANKTKQMLKNIPHYAKGIGGVAESAWDGLKAGGGWVKDKSVQGAKWTRDKVADGYDWASGKFKQGAKWLWDKAKGVFGINTKNTGNLLKDFGKRGFKTVEKKAIDKLTGKAEDEFGIEEGGGKPNFKYQQTSPFGMRLHPITGMPKGHAGVDFAFPMNTPVPAQTDGNVIFSGYGTAGSGYGGYGKVVAIKNGGMEILYAHLNSIAKRVGDHVSAGERIGNSGSTGQSTGPHLHYEVRKNGTPVDPMKLESGGGKGNWKQQIRKAAKRMKTDVTRGQVTGIYKQIMRESGGDQNKTQSAAVNDINMRMGNPAQGLLQYIPDSFNKYKVKGHGNIKSGYDQLLAFFNNSNWKSDLPYGTSGWGPSGARRFKDGGIVNTEQLAWIADGGWAESIISHDPSKRVSQQKIWENTGDRLGFTNGDNNEILKTLERIADSVENDPELQVVMNERVVGSILEPTITNKQKRKNHRDMRNKRR